VSAAQRQRGENYIAAGRAEGGRIAAGGGRPAHLDRGWYIEPTVFADLDPAATLAREEVFGPVLAVLPTTPSTTPYASPTAPNTGSAAPSGPATKNGDSTSPGASRPARSASTSSTSTLASAFGGVKASGLGRELGPEGLAAYVSYKSIYTRG